MIAPDNPDRLTDSPLPCKVCSNCDRYYVGPRCGVCGWVDDDDADDTDLFTPEIIDPPGGEGGV